MIRSMTGFGRARKEGQFGAVDVEVRCTNGRFLKIFSKLPSELTALEHRIHKLCQKHIRRGTVDIYIRFTPSADMGGGAINKDLATSYKTELEELAKELGLPSSISIDTLATLNGVVGVGDLTESQVEDIWPIVKEVMDEALSRACEMRLREGDALDKVFLDLLDQAEKSLEHVDARIKDVAGEYRARLLERVSSVLEELGTTLEDNDVVREVALFVERSDISEETSRFRSHIDQFREGLKKDGEVGKRLEFLTQELHREANTMGSKCNDAELTSLIVETKAIVEKLREQVMNVE